MKSLRKNLLFKTLTLCGVVALAMTACEEEDGNVIDYRPGQHLAISGPSAVYVGDTDIRYYILNNRKDLDHSWSINNGATITEDSENDAFVYIDFIEPTGHTLEVSTSSASGSKSIAVASRDVSFSADTVFVEETIVNDTLTIPLAIGGGFNGVFDVSYSLSGSLDESQYDIVAGYESPYTVDKSANSHIKLVIYPDAALTDTLDVVLTINSITPVMDNEYVAGEELQKIVYRVVDDLKVASMDTTTVTINDPADLYSFPVTLSNPAGDDDILVTYTISGAVGVSDATPTDVPNTLVFKKGMTERAISISVADSAFDNDQTVTITLNTVVTTDGEASIHEDLNFKTIEIEE
ncbi:hypothetical protein C900_02817 [Fulvivirga imtechensis AK7]|uniref:Calx-beta domain-containing protein n=1 Tax=Fulvivirga imtechensis AK7 TaxID=1237149 RepID=L8JUW0_9BACT|nr:hypothetical protein [Fulvivirga imtechensis]ELR71359.1 hypothetical protein C900_02817 [Fulvivirga imtechensis AK7]